MVEKSKLDEDKEGKAVDPSHYRGTIGTLLYLTASRPDLQFAICMYARYQARPTKKHLHAVKMIFRYLRGTANRGLWYPKDSSIALTTFADADHVGCQDTRHSTSGSMQSLGDRLVRWSSKRQKSAVISSTEAEYIAMSKHIDIRFHFIKEHVENGVIELYFVNTEYQLADIFTKPLARERIEFLINKLDLKSKEATLPVVYDVLKLTPFYKAFQISADVPEIYIQEFWATAKVHHHSIHFKMNNKKHIVNLEYFKEMLQICPKLPNQQFEELPFEEAILTFLRDLGHSGEIKMITDVNVNKLHQPWISFAAGMYHKKNVDYAYLLWEDFVYQVENKNVKKSNEMDDYMFTMIKVVSRHEDTQLYGAILPNELMNEDIRNSESYKEYYAIASGAEPPKTKASVKKKQAGSDQAPKATQGKRLKATAKVTKPKKKKVPTQGLETLSEMTLTEEEQMRIVTKRSLTEFHSSHASGLGEDEGTSVSPGVPDSSEEEDDDEVNVSKDNDDDAKNDDDVDKDDEDDDANNQDDEILDDANQDDDDEQTDSDNDGDDFGHPRLSTHDDEARQDHEVNEKESDDESNEEVQGANLEEEEMDKEATHEEDEVTEDTHVIITALINPEGQQQSSSVSSGFVSNMLNPSLDTAVSSIPVIVDAYLANKMHEAVKIDVQLQSERLRDEAQAENADFLNKLDDNIKKIIKDQVKEQVKAQVSKILPKIEKTSNEQLEAEVMTCSSTGSKTSLAIAANLSELELKKILIDKMKSNKSLKDVEMMRIKMKNPPLDQTGGPREDGLEPMHTTKDLEEPAHQEFDTGVTEDQPNEENPQFPDCSLAQKEDPRESFNELMDTPLDFTAFVMNRLKVDTLPPELSTGPTFELIKGSCKSLVELEYLFEEVYKATTEHLNWNNLEGQQYPYDMRKPLPLIPNSRGLRVIPFDHFINNDLEYLRGGVSSRKYATSVTKTKATDYGHIKWIEDLGISHWGRKQQQFYGFVANRESARDVYSKCRIIDVTKLEIVEWHNYKHLDWITVRRDDDKLYKFKEGDFNRLRIQDIKDMLLLLV
ncbi:hypothetical protein Tco_0174252 [Tanacetum coccineum]